MGNRTIDRKTARRLYDKFSRHWREDARAAGRYGKYGTGKPRFNEWWAMYQRRADQAAQSTPQDVREFLSADGVDPWAEPETVGEAAGLALRESHPEPQRGVMTVPIAGDDE